MEEKKICISYTSYFEKELLRDDKFLIDKAKEATQRSYAPYSNFHVGAAVRLLNGEIILGCNQENAAYPAGLCAERTALFAAATTYPNVAVEAIAIAGFYRDKFTDICPPCGSCRQVLLETEKRFNHPVRILLYGIHEIYVFQSVKDMLPLQFSGDNLS